MLIAGLVIGVAFPLVASFFVTPKSTGALWAFVFTCLLAGEMLALFAHAVAMSTSERMLRSVLSQAASVMGLAVHEVHGVDELSQETARVFDNMAVLIEQIRAASTNVRALTAQVLAAAEEQASGAAQQAAAVTQTSATVEELAQTSSQIADNSAAVVRVAERTLARAEEGMQAVAATANGINDMGETTRSSSERILQLGERGQEIGRVLGIIDEIAEQTKILALNAAIEAARAGESGKGFSVVADEIRKLAESVTESTREIDRVVHEIQAATTALVMSTEKVSNEVQQNKEIASSTQGSLERIVSQVEETTDAAKQISFATQQQRTASDQVVVSMREVATVSRQAAETSRQISTAITQLNTLMDTLVMR